MQFSFKWFSPFTWRHKTIQIWLNWSVHWTISFGVLWLFFCFPVVFWVRLIVYFCIVNFLSYWFFFKELGGRVTTTFDKFDAQLCQSNWYLYSIKMQRIILIFTLDTQQLVPIRGYGSIVCSREFFQSVIFRFWSHSIGTQNNLIYKFRQTINGAFSYFMALQQMTAWARGAIHFSTCFRCTLAKIHPFEQFVMLIQQISFITLLPICQVDQFDYFEHFSPQSKRNKSKQ